AFWSSAVKATDCTTLFAAPATTCCASRWPAVSVRSMFRRRARLCCMKLIASAARLPLASPNLQRLRKVLRQKNRKALAHEAFPSADLSPLHVAGRNRGNLPECTEPESSAATRALARSAAARQGHLFALDR